MKKTVILAIKKLPSKYVADGGKVFEAGECIVAQHPNLPPMIFKNGKWKEIKP